MQWGGVGGEGELWDGPQLTPTGCTVGVGATCVNSAVSNAGVGDRDRAAQKAPERGDRQTDIHTRAVHYNMMIQDEPDSSKTRVFGLSVGEEIMTLDLFVLIQYQSVTDRRRDRWTDGWADGRICWSNTSACIACYATALVKSAFDMQRLKEIGLTELKLTMLDNLFRTSITLLQNKL